MKKYAIILGVLSLAACSDNTPEILEKIRKK